MLDPVSPIVSTRVRIARAVSKLEPIDLAVAADGLPVVGRLAGNVFISACHGHSVWPLAFATAPLLADYIAGGDTSSAALAALSPARFGGPGPIRALKQLFDRTAP
ncbi:hypothetical protein DIPPA_07451 [Diplonema papillatum]|nr:hypothetical protein DIPPA_07451 [Diplonema papillatum]